MSQVGSNRGEAHNLHCPQCGAVLQLPAEFYATSATCAYCHFVAPIPRYVVEARARAHAIQVETEASLGGYTDRMRREQRWRVVLTWILVGLGSIGFVWIIVGRWSSIGDAPTAPSLDDSAENRLDYVERRIDELVEQGCAEPEFDPLAIRGSWYDVPFSPTRPGECIMIVAATGVRDNDLGIRVKNPAGKEVDVVSAPRELEYRFCAAEAGDHRLELESRGHGFSVGAVLCPRD